MSENIASAARAEREAAKTMDLGGQRFTLVVALVLFLASLLLPYAGGARGWESLLFGVVDGGVKISIMETIASWLRLIGLVVLTPVTVLTRRAVPGLVAWMMVTVAFFISLWGFWFRESTDNGPQVGMWLAVLASALAFVAYSLVALRKSPEQQEAARRVRAAAGQLGPVSKVQREAAVRANPLLVDDRRRQAAERYRRQSSAQTPTMPED